MTVADKTERQDGTSRWVLRGALLRERTGSMNQLAAHIKGHRPSPPKAKCPEQGQNMDSRPLHFSLLCKVLRSGLNTLGLYLKYSSQLGAKAEILSLSSVDTGGWVILRWGCCSEHCRMVRGLLPSAHWRLGAPLFPIVTTNVS